MQRIKFTFFTLIVLFLISSWITNDRNLLELIKNQLSKFNSFYPQEKTYVHTDKPYYALGEDIWFKVYRVNGMTHLPDSLGNLMYVELVNPDNQVLAVRHIRLQNGGGAGDFHLEPSWPAGNYLIRAYTHYMRNFDAAFFFQQEIKVWDAGMKAPVATEDPESIDFDVQFFPEGGDLVQDITSYVGIKAVNQAGLGIDITGKVYDDQGNFIVAFETIRFGHGFMIFTPEAGKRYYANVIFQGQTKIFWLPEALVSGYVLQITQQKGNQLFVSARTNIPGGLVGGVMIGHIRGKIFYEFVIEKDLPEILTKIDTKTAPEGIAHFTLFTKNGEPVSERLIFIENTDQQPVVQIKTDKETYNKRSPVQIAFQLNDAAQQPLQANLSVTITDEETVRWSPYGQDIRTYFLLSSDLKGQIENPGYYFDVNNKDRNYLLNLLLLTQGWRRFAWRDLLTDNFMPLPHAPEDGFTISGLTTRAFNADKSVQADVFLSVLDSPFVMSKFTTHEDGRFMLPGFQFHDTISVILQANIHNEKRAKKGKEDDPLGPQGNRNVAILLDTFASPDLQSRVFAYRAPLPESNLATKFLSDIRRIGVIDSIYRGIWSIDLDEISVTASRQDPLEAAIKEVNPWYNFPDRRFILDSVAASYSFPTVFQFLQGRVPGVQIGGQLFQQYAIIRGPSSINLPNPQATILLDGVEISNSFANVIPIQDIAVVDVIKGVTSLRGGGGVIAIYTRQGLNLPVKYEFANPGIKNVKFPGFYKAREFYTPKYDRTLPEHDKPDFRTTLYWNPIIQTDQNGQATVSFYTGDKESIYHIRLEGITKDGRPVFVSKTIRVQSDR